MVVALLLLLAVSVGALRLLRRAPPGWLNSAVVYRRAVLVGWSLAVVLLLSWMIPALGPLPFFWHAAGKMLGFALLLVAPLWVVPSRWLPLAAAGWVAVISFVGFSDLVYSRHFGNLVPVTALFGAGQTWAIRESIGALVRLRDLTLLLPVAAAVAVAVGAPAAPARTSRRGRLALAGLAFGCALPGLAMTIHNVDHWRARKVLSHPRMMRSLGLFGTHVVDAARLLREALGRGQLTPEQREQVVAYYRSQPPAPQDGPLFGVARGANVLVIQVESLQQFVVGLTVAGQEVTPFLNRWRERGAFYRSIVDQTGEANTADAEYSVFNSQQPMRHGAVVFRRPENDFVTWPAQLKAAGWRTFSAHPWDRGFWNRAVVHPRYGFDRSLFREEFGAEQDRVGWGSSDAEFYARVTPELLALESPFVAYLITLMAHHPYTFFPADRRRLQLGALDETMLGAYLQLMHEVDRSLGAFLDQLDAAGRLEGTLVVVFGDHDARLQLTPEAIALAAEAFAWPPERLAQLGSRDPRLDFVPLFLRLPGGELRGEIDTVGGHLDIGPTILHLLGEPVPPSFLGRPLLPERAGFAARIDGSALAQDRFFVATGCQVPDGGACLSWPSGSPLPLDACRPLAADSAAQVRVSWLVTELNLLRGQDSTLDIFNNGN